MGKGGTSPLGTSVYPSRGAAVVAGGHRVCPPSLVTHLNDIGVAVGAPPLSEAWGTSTYTKAGFGSGACFLLEVAPVGLLMARTTDLRPSNKSPSKKKPPRQASLSPVGAAEPPPPKARRNLGLEQGSAEPATDLIGALDKVIKAGSARLTTAAESPKGAAAEVEAAPADTPATATNAAVQGAGGKGGPEVDEASIECARCGLEMTSDAKLKKHLKNDHGLDHMTDQELADMAIALLLPRARCPAATPPTRSRELRWESRLSIDISSSTPTKPSSTVTRSILSTCIPRTVGRAVNFTRRLPPHAARSRNTARRAAGSTSIRRAASPPRRNLSHRPRHYFAPADRKTGRAAATNHPKGRQPRLEHRL